MNEITVHINIFGVENHTAVRISTEPQNTALVTTMYISQKNYKFNLAKYITSTHRKLL